MPTPHTSSPSDKTFARKFSSCGLPQEKEHRFRLTQGKDNLFSENRFLMAKIIPFKTNLTDY
jgi:hypothetical protein